MKIKILVCLSGRRILESMSQDKRIESHIRTMLSQVVSSLEGLGFVYAFFATQIPDFKNFVQDF